MKWWSEDEAIPVAALVVLVLVFFAMGLSGCAGHQAMVIARPPVQEPCGIVVCESRTGRIDYERDCACSGKRSIEEILR